MTTCTCFGASDSIACRLICQMFSEKKREKNSEKKRTFLLLDMTVIHC